MADLSQFQPRYPEGRVLAPLFEQAAELVAECHRLGGGKPENLSFGRYARA